MRYVLAQVNVARLCAPLENPALADFVAALDPVNAAADVAPGFVWRLQTEDGNATAVRAFEWDAAGSAGVIVNMSVWESADALAAFVYSEAHLQVLRGRRRWFESMSEAYTALWWIRRGTIPSIIEAEHRVRHLRAHGPTPDAFTLRKHFPPPRGTERRAQAGHDEWKCPPDAVRTGAAVAATWPHGPLRDALSPGDDSATPDRGQRRAQRASLRASTRQSAVEPQRPRL